MNFEVYPTPEFKSQAKALQKRHRSFKNDLKNLIISLQQNPFQGIDLGQGIHKIKMAITSKRRGKTGGASIITYTVVSTESGGKVFLMNVYDKADFSTVDVSVIRDMINNLGK